MAVLLGVFGLLLCKTCNKKNINNSFLLESGARLYLETLKEHDFIKSNENHLLIKERFYKALELSNQDIENNKNVHEINKRNQII